MHPPNVMCFLLNMVLNLLPVWLSLKWSYLPADVDVSKVGITSQTFWSMAFQVEPWYFCHQSFLLFVWGRAVVALKLRHLRYFLLAISAVFLSHSKWSEIVSSKAVIKWYSQLKPTSFQLDSSWIELKCLPNSSHIFHHLTLELSQVGGIIWLQQKPSLYSLGIRCGYSLVQNVCKSALPFPIPFRIFVQVLVVQVRSACSGITPGQNQAFCFIHHNW